MKNSNTNKYIVVIVLVILVAAVIYTASTMKNNNKTSLSSVNNQTCNSLISVEDFKDLKVYWNNKVIPGFFTVYYDGYDYTIGFVSSYTDTFRFELRHSKDDNTFTFTSVSGDWLEYVFGRVIKYQPLDLPNIQLFLPDKCQPQKTAVGKVRYKANYNLSTTAEKDNTLTYCLTSVIPTFFNSDSISRVVSIGKGYTDASCITEWTVDNMVKTIDSGYPQNQLWSFRKWNAESNTFVESTDSVKYGDTIRIKTSTLSRDSKCKDKYLTGGRGVPACSFVTLDEVDSAVSYFTVTSPLGDFSGDPVALGEPLKFLFKEDLALYGSMPTSTSIDIKGNISTFDGNFDVYTWENDRWFSPEHTWLVKTPQ